MKDRNNKIDCVDWSIASSQKSVAPWRGTTRQEYERNEKKKTKKRLGVECQRLRTETWAKTANRKCRAAALSGHCWRDLCKAPVNENSRQLKTSSLSHATWHAQAQYNLMKREAKQRQQASSQMVACQRSGWLHHVFFHMLAPLSWLQVKYNQCHTKLDVITVHNKEKKSDNNNKTKKKGPLFYISFHPFI